MKRGFRLERRHGFAGRGRCKLRLPALARPCPVSCLLAGIEFGSEAPAEYGAAKASNAAWSHVLSHALSHALSSGSRMKVGGCPVLI